MPITTVVMWAHGGRTVTPRNGTGDAIGVHVGTSSQATAAGGGAVEGLKFLLAPGGPTAPHISYLGEIVPHENPE